MKEKYYQMPSRNFEIRQNIKMLDNQSEMTLDGKIVLRSTYAIDEGGGGVERYLDDLDKSLL